MGRWLLVIFTSVLVVLVLGCVTLMLTVFHPHLQEGKEYAEWLKDKNTYSSGVIRSEQISVGSSVRQKNKKAANPRTSKRAFPISVTNAPGASGLVNALLKAGFSAEIYRHSGDKDSNRPEQHETIWVGYAVPAKEAIESIKIAVSHWPHLKYMQLSNEGGAPPDEVHYQMYSGGASSTAKREELSPWSNEELLGLDEKMSQEKFHQVIRKKNITSRTA